MNTLKGIIEDLNDDETYIGGCTTPGEIIITLYDEFEKYIMED